MAIAVALAVHVMDHSHEMAAPFRAVPVLVVQTAMHRLEAHRHRALQAPHGLNQIVDSLHLPYRPLSPRRSPERQCAMKLVYPSEEITPSVAQSTPYGTRKLLLAAFLAPSGPLLPLCRQRLGRLGVAVLVGLAPLPYRNDRVDQGPEM